MQSRNYFRASWLLQLLAGLALFIVSFWLQANVMAGFLATPMLALAITGALETSKALSIVWHRYMSQSGEIYPAATRMVSGVFRSGLLLLSLLSSLLFLGAHLDRPRLAEARQADLQTLAHDTRTALNRLEKTRQQRLAALRERETAARDTLAAQLQKHIDQLENRLQQEMNNVVHGQFKGPRYRELEKRLDQAQRELSQRLEQHDQQQAMREQALEQRIEQQRQQIEKRDREQRQRIASASYLNDQRAGDPRIVAFINLAQSLVGIAVTPQALVFAFALLLGLLLELGIVLAFDTLTIAMAPAIHAHHRSEMDKQIYSAQVHTDMQRENARRKAVMDKLKKQAQATINTAEEMVAAAQRA